VEEDDRRGARGRRGAKYFTRVDDAGVERADRNERRPQNAVLRVEQEDAEMLDGPRAELRHEHLGDVTRGADLHAFAPPAHQRATARLHRGNQLGRPRATDAGHAAKVVGRRAGQPMQSADGVEDRIRQVERAGPGHAMPEDDRKQLVVSQSRHSDALELLTRAIVRRNALHLRSSGLLYFAAVRRLLVIGLLLLIATACSEPPNKEIDQAQTALDIARTAGADKYATDEYNSAASALQKARAAVDQRDYRQALNYAIDSRQRSQDAINQAAEGKARAQRAADDLIGFVSKRALEVQARLKTAEAARVPPKDLRALRAVVLEAQTGLQEARAQIGGGNYDKATASLVAVREKLDAAVRTMESLPQHPTRKKGKS